MKIINFLIPVSLVVTALISIKVVYSRTSKLQGEFKATQIQRVREVGSHTIVDGFRSSPASGLDNWLTSSKECPNIAGAFQRPGDNLIIYWNQDGCNISSDAPSSGFDHEVKGKWVGTHFDTTTKRRNIQNGCTTLMYGKVYKLSESQLRTVVYGSDGRCDLPANFTEDSVLIRR
jgi:hypothetical protein